MEVPEATSPLSLPTSLAVAGSSEPQSHTQEGILAILTCWSSLIEYDYVHHCTRVKAIQLISNH